MTADGLARVWIHASVLLRAVDADLAGRGAPPDHPVWDRLRHTGALPGDAVEHFLWLDPQTVRDTHHLLIDEAESMQDAVRQVRGTSWRGAGADAYVARWARLVDFAEGANARMTDTAQFLAEAAAWLQDSRDQLAMELAFGLGSREAVSIRMGLPISGTASADLAERILAVVAGCLDAGWRLRERWVERVAEVPWREPAGGHVVATGHLEVR